MSAESRFFNHDPIHLIRESFNRFARGLPSELNIAAIQLEADISYHDMFEHMEEVQKEGRAFSEITFELYEGAIENYRKLIDTGIELINYYEKELNKAKLNKAKLDTTELDKKVALTKIIETYTRYLTTISRYYEEIIKPNYEQLQEIPQIMLRSLREEAELSYHKASHLNALTEHYIVSVKEYKKTFDDAIKAHTILLCCLEIIANNIKTCETPNEEKLQSIVKQYQDASENLIMLEHSLSEYRLSHEKQGYRPHDSRSSTSSDQSSSSGSEEAFGLYDQTPELVSSDQGSSSDSQEELTSESPDYTADSAANAKQDTKITQSDEKSPAFFNENQRSAKGKGTAHHTEAISSSPTPW